MRNPLPRLWLLSDARNDAVLERALLQMPRGSGFVFRHYHLGESERRRRFARLRRVARGRGMMVALSSPPALARRWGADAVYGSANRIGGAHRLCRLATAHDMAELGAVNRAGADLVFISPVHPTRSHSGGAWLGPARAMLLARRAMMPVVFLGGMDRTRARRMAPHGWAAIDGLSG